MSSVDLVSQRRIFEACRATRLGLREERRESRKTWNLVRSGFEPEVFDVAHSDEEDRYVAIGPIERGIIVVVFTERDDETIRIISARVATRRERQRYEAWEVRAID